MSSPTTSLLFPPNPASLTIDLAPKGGILINRRRLSDLSPSDVEIPDPFSSNQIHTRQRSESEAPPAQSPKTPVIDAPPSILASRPLSPMTPNRSPRIRFAPLPDPRRRPRRASTGRNMIWKSTTGPDGQDQRQLFIDRGDAGDAEDESAVDDEEINDEDGEGEDADGSKRGRGWSTSMAKGSWMGTKKLLTMGIGGLTAKEETYEGGGPLKKSLSTGGFIGASAFRFSNETERKSNMLGPTPAVYRTEHRRQSSLEPPGTSLDPARNPVRMLNGRVYGSRRASEAAERQRREREAAEPAFIEWGHGKQGSGLGSNQSYASGDRAEEEDGSGMEWVKRRREERRQREAQERQSRESGQESGGESDGGSSPVLSNAPSLSSIKSPNPASAGPNLVSSPLSPTTSAHEPQLVTPHSITSHIPSPMILLSDPSTSSSPRTLLPAQDGKQLQSPTSARKASGHSFTDLNRYHVSQAINISPTQGRRNEGEGRGASVFGDQEKRKAEGESDDEDEEREEEGTGDFEEDDDEEVAQEESNRSTSAAAGVEIMSRHKH